MNISTRITEYSITGGLLWVNVFLFVTLLELSEGSINLNAASKVWATWIAAMAPLKATLEMALPAALQSSLGTLLGALVIIVIFFSGIVLDLIAPLFFVPIELYFFRKWLVQKKHPMAWFEQRRYFQKISAFLLSHIMVFSQAAALEELMDRIHLWRTSRAISTSMVVVAVLLTFGPRGVAHHPWMIATVVPLLVTLISALITLGTYSRMCLFLCSLTYSTMRRESVA